jgi:hypothetical protein
MKQRKRDRRYARRAGVRLEKAMNRYLHDARGRAMRAAGTDPDKARDEAFILRMQHDLCLHQDDERVYRSDAERQADDRPAAKCSECGKVRLVVSIMANGPVSADAEALIVKNYLR